MANNELRLRLASQYPYLSSQTGFGEDSNPIEQILSSVGSAPTSGLSPFANSASVGADNKTLAANTNDAVQNIFALVRNASVDATNRAKEAAAKRAAEEANAKAVAMQKRILEAQKKAALQAVKNIPTGANTTSSPQGNYPLTPMPKLPGNGVKSPKQPKLVLPPAIDLPDAKPPVIAPKQKIAKRDPRKPGIQN